MRIIPQPDSCDIFPTYTVRKQIDEKIISDRFSNDEEYELYITPDKIVATAGGNKGLYYADVTFRQIKTLYDKIHCMKIKDSPRYSHRGFMIDCARHMFTVNELKKMIDAAAFVKLNKFHWHLSDDQGFRIALDCFPELTEKGSVRKCDTFRNMESSEKYGGYYTKAEISEIVTYCNERYIDIIPELDMPGHLSAFLHVFPQFTCSGKPVEVKTQQGIFSDILCVGNEDGISYIKKILDEICDLFPYDEIHIGGDEVPKKNWKACDKCGRIMKENNLGNLKELQGWFMNKMKEYLKSKGKKCIVWNDCVAGGNIDSDFIIQYWLHTQKKTAEMINNGTGLILSPFTPYYVDYPYGMNPLKAVYEYEPDDFKGLEDKGRRNIIGVESPIWTEFVKTDDRLEYQCFPRWFAVAETAWTDKKNRSYKEFEAICKKLVKVYNNNGINAASADEWNPGAVSRLKKTLSFFMP